MRPLALLTVGLIAGGLVSAPVPKVKPKDESTILGTWKGEGYDSGRRQDVVPVDLAGLRFVFEEGGTFRQIEGKTEFRGAFKMDPDATPKAIDLCLDGIGKDGQSEEVLCVYELDGDTLKVCFTEPNRPRPLALKPEGVLAPVITFKRVKDEPKKDK